MSTRMRLWRWAHAGLASVVLLTMTLAACDGSSTTYKHDATVNPRFAIYLTNGKQGASWVHNQPNTDPCHDWSGSGTQNISFTAREPLYVFAVKVGDTVKFVKGDYLYDYDTLWKLGTPPNPIIVSGTYDRQGTSDYSRPASCGKAVGDGDGGGSSQPPDCGIRQIKPGLTQIDYNNGKLGIMPYQGGNWYPFHTYQHCPTDLDTNPYQTTSKAVGGIGGQLIPRFQANLPESQLYDGSKLSFTISLPETTAATQVVGKSQRQLSQSWDMTFCRLNSDQSFNDAFQTAMTYLKGSDIFTSSMNDVNMFSKYVAKEGWVYEELANADGSEKLEHPLGAPGNRGKAVVAISWNHLSDTTRMASVVAHEMYHAIATESQRFDPSQTVPFLTLSEFKALEFQSEYEANVFTFHVLKELEKYPDRKPCIEALLNSTYSPILHSLQIGNDALARTWLIHEYASGVEDGYSIVKHVILPTDEANLADVKANVDLLRQSGRIQELVTTWNTSKG